MAEDVAAQRQQRTRQESGEEDDDDGDDGAQKPTSAARPLLRRVQSMIGKWRGRNKEERKGV